MLLIYFTFIDNPKDCEKFEQLYNLYKTRMLSVAYNILRDSCEAEDAVHTAFIAIAKNTSCIDDPCSNRSLSYVLKAAKHTALNVANSKWNQVKYENIDDLYDLSEEDFAESIICSDNYNRLVECIKSMDDTYRDVLYLHFVEEMSAKQISMLLYQKLATTKQQLVRGKRILITKIIDEVNQNEFAKK